MTAAMYKDTAKGCCTLQLYFEVICYCPPCYYLCYNHLTEDLEFMFPSSFSHFIISGFC